MCPIRGRPRQLSIHLPLSERRRLTGKENSASESKTGCQPCGERIVTGVSVHTIPARHPMMRGRASIHVLRLFLRLLFSFQSPCDRRRILISELSCDLSVSVIPNSILFYFPVSLFHLSGIWCSRNTHTFCFQQYTFELELEIRSLL